MEGRKRDRRNNEYNSRSLKESKIYTGCMKHLMSLRHLSSRVLVVLESICCGKTLN
jgi:hypothetical protein